MTVAVGDSFWSIAERQVTTQLGRAPTDTEVVEPWLALIDANRDRLVDPTDPDLLHPGQVLRLGHAQVPASAGPAISRDQCGHAPLAEAVSLLLFGREQLAISAMAWTMEPHGYHVTVTSSVEDFVIRADEDQPEICLVSDDLAGDEIIAAIADARRLVGSNVLVLTSCTDMTRRNRSVDAGAVACIDTATTLTQLLAIMSSVRARRKDSTAPPFIQTPVGLNGRGRGGPARFLTPRELESLRGMVHGESTVLIAGRLGVRPATARTHIQNVLMKLGVTSRIEAVAYAVQHEVVEPDACQPRHGRRAEDATCS